MVEISIIVIQDVSLTQCPFHKTPTRAHIQSIHSSYPQLAMDHHHFLIVIFPTQGLINPSRHLARRLARTTGARVTLSTTISAHRRMFPSSTKLEHHDGVICYLPYSDGFDEGNIRSKDYMSRSAAVGSHSLSTLARDLADQGHPITCIIYALLLTWAIDVADDLAVPSVLFWPQPATVFALYHRYFHGYATFINSHKNDPSTAVNLPGLPQFQIRDFPSFLTLPDISTEDKHASVLSSFEGMFDKLDHLAAKFSKLIILVNTFEELEQDAMSAVEGVKMLAIGPTLLGSSTGTDDGKEGNLFEESRGYMEWLDSKEAGSVVYVSFGSLVKLSSQQIEEVLRGLVQTGRPYLWVLRKDGREGDEEIGLEGAKMGLGMEGGEMGMVVEWCSQVKVLHHRSVGCFVTHGGWNSTLEALVCGVPMVMVPQWSDQRTNAKLAEVEWGVGVRVEVVGEEGLVEGTELKRCVDLVMGDGEKGGEIRKKAKLWREKAQDAMGEEGSSVRNLRAFVEAIQSL